MGTGRIKTFAYLNAEKSSVYLAVMRVFTEAKARFALHLRPQEIIDELRASYDGSLPIDADTLDSETIDAVLNQLCEWGNLTSHPDTTDVATVEEFYRPRYLFQITREGEAADQALSAYERALRESGELQAAALSDIRALLGELLSYCSSAEPDEAKVHRTLSLLRTRFRELTSKAQTFIASLQRTIDLHEKEVEAFRSYKEALIDYLERFIGELVIATADIAATLETLRASGVDKLLRIAADRDLADAVSPTDQDRAAAVSAWVARWDGLRGWFINLPDHASQAEILRARARSAIPALLSAVAGINERRANRSDRSTDLRTLARWFAQADTDLDAHRLWRAAFGLTPARHLRIDQQTLDERDAKPVPPQESWLSAPPLCITPRLRQSGRYTRRGRPNEVIDCAAEKARLARAAEVEAEQIEAARRRLATGERIRLSEIGELDSAAFDLFLDLLGEALAARGTGNSPIETTSSDGSIVVKLSPIGNGHFATIKTSAGHFRGPDHFVVIRHRFGERKAAVSSADADENADDNGRLVPREAVR